VVSLRRQRKVCAEVELQMLEGSEFQAAWAAMLKSTRDFFEMIVCYINVHLLLLLLLLQRLC